MIREFSVEITQQDAAAIGGALAAPGDTRVYPELKAGRKTFAFDQNALIAVADGDFERFLWSSFDRVEEKDGIITLAKGAGPNGAGVVFYLPVSKLQDPEIRRSIWDFVSGRVGLNG